MITSRTPVRISFFGGGTDYPTWYREHGGAVLASSINHYSYITVQHLPPFFDYTHSIAYSQVEHVQSIDDIQHAAVREALRFMDVREGIAMNYNADLPARTGLGSSSTFTVGLLHALYAFQGLAASKMRLAMDAIHVEQDLIGEAVGSQDQTCAAFGGFNRISFHQDGGIEVLPMMTDVDRLAELQDHLMLIFTGFSRSAPQIARQQIDTLNQKGSEMSDLQAMVDEGADILCNDRDLEEFGKLLHESWLIKRSLSPLVSTPEIDGIYETAQQAGAVGGKLLGAGGGGFLLIFARPEKRNHLRQALKGLLVVPFRFENLGSQIIFRDPEGQYPEEPRSLA